MNSNRGVVFAVCVLAACLSIGSCGFAQKPAIEFTTVPEAGPGGAAVQAKIAGRVRRFQPQQKIVLFAKSGTWWVQPFASKPFTAIQADGTWTNSTHHGTDYAALLVDPGYSVPKVADVLPEPGGAVAAVASVKGLESTSAMLTPSRMEFSGYNWEVFRAPSDSFGAMHENRASNVWTDEKGWLHLKIAKEKDQWTGAEMNLVRSLGYGTYSFAIHELPRMEPATVLAMLAWDPLDAGQNHREFDVQLSQFGDPAIKNAQFTLQPYYVPANLHRFNAPRGPLTHSFRWEAGRISFETRETGGSRVVAEHVFTSGTPTPGGEQIHINLYVFGKAAAPQQNGVEVVIEKFTYLP